MVPVWESPLNVEVNGPVDELENSNPVSAAIEMVELSPEPVTEKLVVVEAVP